MSNEPKDAIDELEDAVQDLWTGGDLDSAGNRLKQARAELTRRSELAAKYERLTRALSDLARRDKTARRGGYQLYVSSVHAAVGDLDDPGAWTQVASERHDGTPDGIAAAIIAAAEGAE